MKKIPTYFFLTFAILFLLTSCTRNDSNENKTIYSINIGSTQYTVDTDTMSITDDLYTYNYSINGDTVTISYPDGSSYWWTYITHGGYGGWSDNYDPEKYARGDDLLLAIEYNNDMNSDTTDNDKIYNPFGFLFITLGIFNIVKPEKAWYFAHGWRYKNAEPSDEALVAERIGGGILIITGILIFV